MQLSIWDEDRRIDQARREDTGRKKIQCSNENHSTKSFSNPGLSDTATGKARIRKGFCWILALPVAASERDIAKRINELSTFAEFGKTKDYHTDFNFISPINRSVEDIEEAAKAIELPEKKLYHSLFWFWNHNSIDDLVFDI